MRELSLNILDIVQNSITAGATLITVRVEETSAADRLTIAVADNGKGMTTEQVARVMDPFYTTRTTRKVGMGIPLFRMAAEMTGGSLSVESAPGVGTTTAATFCLSHIDRMPLGDIADTMVTLIRLNPQLDFVYRHTVDDKVFELDTRALRDILGYVPLNEPEVIGWISDYFTQGLAELDSQA